MILFIFVIDYRLRMPLFFQLQHLVTDEACVQALQLYNKEKVKGACGGPVVAANSRVAQEMAYQRKAEQLLAEENCHRITIVSTLVKATL